MRVQNLFLRLQILAGDAIRNRAADGLLGWCRFFGAQAVGHAAEVAEVFHRGAGGELVGDFDDRSFAHAVNQQIALGVEHDRAADFVAPVIVMCDPAQAGFHAAGDDRHAFVRLAGALAVGQRAAVGATADAAAGAVGVVVAHFAVGGVVVDHRVHVAGADGEEQPRAAERAPRFARVPIGLTENGDAESFVFQQTAEQCHREAGMIDVGVAGDEDDIDRSPSRGRPFRRGSWGAGDEGGRRKAEGGIGRQIVSSRC